MRPRDVWPIASTTNERARLLLAVCQLLGWDKILGEPGMILEHIQKLGSLLVGPQAEGNRCNEVMTALGPCKSNPRWKISDKEYKEIGDGFHRRFVSGARRVRNAINIAQFDSDSVDSS